MPSGHAHVLETGALGQRPPADRHQHLVAADLFRLALGVLDRQLDALLEDLAGGDL